MTSNPTWQAEHAEFIDAAQAHLQRLEDCLAHLNFIGPDTDAVMCAQGCLSRLSEQATLAGVLPIAQHCRSLSRLIRVAQLSSGFDASLLSQLRECLNLLAWQVELIDPATGQLLLDPYEQERLLEQMSTTVTSISNHPRSTDRQPDLLDPLLCAARQAM